nr:ribonuclease H-like domain-containing protein [Tanacetum cinerariifolium]
MVTHAKARIFKPLECRNFHVTTTLPLPRSHVHALHDPNWKKTILDEYNALITNRTWVLVPCPANVNVVRSMWPLKHKFHADGSLSKYEARLVAIGRSQQQGVVCDETFSLVVKPATNHTVLSLSVSRDWPIHLLDLKNAFLHGQLSEPVYMHQPPGFVDSTKPDYRSLAGALQYLTFTHPDLSYVVQQAGCLVTRQSTSGYCVFFGDNLLSWFAKRHVTLFRSSAEAEYHGVANVVTETAWICNLLRELHTPLFTATLFYYDNVSAVYLSTNLVQHQRTNHIEIDIHFVHDYVALGQVQVLHVPSRFNFANIFTKGLPITLFIDFRSSLNVRMPPAHTAREY